MDRYMCTLRSRVEKVLTGDHRVISDRAVTALSTAVIHAVTPAID
jgi:hypothetical protein